jgi:glycerate 2-kinase
MDIQPGQFATKSLRESPRGGDICRILASAINHADAGEAVLNSIVLQGNQLVIAGRPYDLTEYDRILIIGIGKAIYPMLSALHGILANRITSAFAITKRGYIGSKLLLDDPRVSIVEASHPVPDRSNLQASASLVAMLHDLTAHDLVICLLSGGGSALLVQPPHGISLCDLRLVTQLLLSSGADIGEMNAIRKHLDSLKGGGLARLLYPASVVSLIISDVVGDHLDHIASGPTVADPTTFQAAWAVLKKYRLIDQVPPAIRHHLKAGVTGTIPETLKPGDPIFDHVVNVIIGSNSQAARLAEDSASRCGFHARLLTTSLQGEASQAGKSLTESVKSLAFFSPPFPRPACFIAGGETTVTIHGAGLGGRNQELALGAVDSLSGDASLLLVSLATDGGDGPTDAAGAVATHQTKSLGLSLGLDSAVYLANNDAYHYFERLGDLLKTGPTLTNVNDLVFIFAL